MTHAEQKHVATTTQMWVMEYSVVKFLYMKQNNIS